MSLVIGKLKDSWCLKPFTGSVKQTKPYCLQLVSNDCFFELRSKIKLQRSFNTVPRIFPPCKVMLYLVYWPSKLDYHKSFLWKACKRPSYDVYRHYTKWVLYSSDPPTGVSNAAISVGLSLSWFTSGVESPKMDTINNNVHICKTTSVRQTFIH